MPGTVPTADLTYANLQVKSAAFPSRVYLSLELSCHMTDSRVELNCCLFPRATSRILEAAITFLRRFNSEISKYNISCDYIQWRNYRGCRGCYGARPFLVTPLITSCTCDAVSCSLLKCSLFHLHENCHGNIAYFKGRKTIIKNNDQ